MRPSPLKSATASATGAPPAWNGLPGIWLKPPLPSPRNIDTRAIAGVGHSEVDFAIAVKVSRIAIAEGEVPAGNGLRRGRRSAIAVCEKDPDFAVGGRSESHIRLAIAIKIRHGQAPVPLTMQFRRYYQGNRQRTPPRAIHTMSNWAMRLPRPANRPR